MRGVNEIADHAIDLDGDRGKNQGKHQEHDADAASQAPPFGEFYFRVVDIIRNGCHRDRSGRS